MQKTFLELKEADALIGELYAKKPELKNSKFGYAWGKFSKKNIDQYITELNNRLEDSRVENCLVDEKTKEILKDDRGMYKYSKEGMRGLLDTNRKLLKEYEEKIVEVIPFIVKTENLPELSESEQELLKGLIIAE